MQRFLLGFCGSAMILGLPWPGGPELPLRLAWLAGAGLVLLAAARPAWRGRRAGAAATLTAGALVGLVWSGAAHHGALAARLADTPRGDAVAITARIVSDPIALAVAPGQPPALRFQARLLHQTPRDSPAQGPVVRLSWYGAEPLARGELWRFQAVLQGPWSYANPGGFDYERWLLGAGIQGTGYVRAGEREASAEPPFWSRARSFLRQVLGESGLARRGILLALLTGDAAGIGEQQWAVFRATGTVHLMVISGLHVSLAAGLGFALGRWGLALCPPLLAWLDARRAGCLCGALVAAGYVVLAGAGLPAMRALLMSVSVLALLAWGRTGAVGGALLLALVVILVREPLAVHQQGFWLSFGAVAILLLVYRMRRRSGGALRELVRAQLALSVGMLPLVALTTATVPWTGVPANLLAVPVVSLAVVPVNLLGGTLAPLWPQAAELAFRLADLALGALLRWLEWLALAPAVPLAATGGALLVAQAGALAWLLGVPRRYLPVLAACCALPLAPRAPALDHGTYRVTALDVGQGTAVLVETRHHRLLYDAGPGYPSGFETGSAVVVPSLRATGRPRLDTVILSHDDLDHVGGARAVLASVPVAELLTGMPAQGGVSCHGRQWRWDGVDFRVLAVARPAAASDNDRSCVLLVDDGRYRALLAGDVGTAVERRLVRALPPVQLMFAPHHGSLTSSSPALVRVLRPAVVFVSAGRNNRFGHPHPQVVARYRQVGAQLHQTGRHGALIWQSDRPEAVVRWRRDRSPYWRAREGGSVSSR